MKALSLQYKLVNSIAFICWLCLIFLPNFKLIDTVIAQVVVIGLALFYSYLLFVKKMLQERCTQKAILLL